VTDEALVALDRSLTLNDRHAPAYTGRGYYYLLQNDAASAFDQFNQARRFGSDNYELYVGFGRAYYLLGRNREAMLQLNEALRLANEERKVANRERRKGDVYVLLGLVYEATNPPLMEDAIVSWNYVLEMGGASPEARSLAEQHLQILTGRVPTQGPTWTPSPTFFGVITPTRTPTRTVTPGPSPTAGPSPTPTATG
jgi:tetratricopeptide (TPR) repeat protein